MAKVDVGRIYFCDCRLVIVRPSCNDFGVKLLTEPVLTCKVFMHSLSKFVKSLETNTAALLGVYCSATLSLSHIFPSQNVQH